jgi:GNAT superfamily N-acetyltransferase
MTATPITHRVRKAGAADAADISRVLSRSFFDDPVMCWITPDAERRRTLGPAMFTIYVDTYLPLETYITEQRDGVALWAWPGQEPVPEDSVDAFVSRVESVYGDDAARVFAMNALFETHTPEAPHAQLQLFGTLPERQGQGIGSSVLADGLARCDREGVAAYLEATSERNKALYERHGFVVTSTMAPAGGPTLWAMWRDPS